MSEVRGALERRAMTVGCADADPAFVAELFAELPHQRFGFDYRYYPTVAALLADMAVQRWAVVLVDADLIEQPQPVAATLRTMGALRLVATVSRLDHPATKPLMEAGFVVVFRYATSLAFGEAFSQLSVDTRPEPVWTSPAREEPNRTFVFYSPKGGTGKTTLTVNLALLYARKGLRVLVVDLAQFGTVASHLRVSHRGRGLSSLITLLQQDPAVLESGRFDEYLQAALAVYTFKGGTLDVLLAAPPTKMDQLGMKQTEGLLGRIADSGRYDVILVDTSSELTERTTGALARATRIILVLTPDFNAAWLGTEISGILKMMYIEKERVAVVFNRVARGLGFAIEECSQLLHWPRIGTLPESYQEVQGGVNLTGLPALKGRTPLVQSMKRLAHKLYPVFSPSDLGGDWLWHLRKFLKPARPQ